jgi:hypothetical protein
MPSFPIELLDSVDSYRSGLPSRQGNWTEPYPQRSAVRPSENAMPGLAALIPLLMSIQGSSDPNIMRWREAQAAQTPPDQTRSMPDMLMALQQLRESQPQQEIDSSGIQMMPMMTEEWKTVPKGQAAQPPADFSKIQELMDMIYQRRGRD